TFIRDGGALLVATDSETAPAIGELLGARVNGGIVKARDSLNMYRNLPECPKVWHGNPHVPAFQDIAWAWERVIATNRPSFVEDAVKRANGPRLPSITAAWYDDAERGKDTFALVFVRDRSDPNGKQRLALLADHSIFINSMMLQDDNGNFQFAQKL